MTSFKPIASHTLPAIHADAQAWIHPCGLRHIHIHADDPHLSLLIHVPTSSDTDDGIAHALEHLVMEGSETYPVDNIISRLSERTMSTFMNAMTSPSATIYPFSSANAADFIQIAKVYLDCVFNPRLPETAFPMEVTRVVLKDGKKDFDGVVFNEMRGVLSDPRRISYQQQRRWLASDSPLTRNSGGDPLHIVDLTLDRLRQFHSEHYHPSRCTVVSYGNVDPATIQALVEQGIAPALARPAGPLAALPGKSTAPVHDAIIDVPHANGQSEHGLYLAWPLPPKTSRFDQALYKMYAALLSVPGGHLNDCLDDLGPASISQCSHVVVAERHYLLVGASSLAEDQVPMARERIVAALQGALADPPHPQTIESILNDTEMSVLMRAASSDNLGHYMCTAVAQVLDLHADCQDILHFIDDHALVTGLRAHPIGSGFTQWLAALAHATPHQAQVRPDHDYYHAISCALEEKLAHRQPQADSPPRKADASSLPSAHASPEVVALPAPVPVQWLEAAPGISLCHVQGGVEGVYDIDLVADLSHMPPERIDLIQSAMHLANGMGVGDTHWKEHASRRQKDGFSPSTHTDVENRADGRVSILQRVSQSSLDHELDKTCWHLVEMIHNCTFDPARLATLLSSVQEDLKSQASARAQHAAHIHSVSGFTPGGSINGNLRGMTGDMAGLQLSRMSQSSPEQLAEDLALALADYRTAPMAVRVIGADVPPQVMDMARRLSALRPEGQAYRPGAPVPFQAPTAPQDTAFIAPMHVNNCIQAWAGPGLLDRQAPAAGLLAQVVSDHYLYGALRDQGGAYGASFSWSDGCFRAVSFRDPRMEGTFEDFDRALEWIQSGSITDEHLQQARIKQLAHMTSPVSLLGRAQNAWNRAIIGVESSIRERFIQGLFDASLEDLNDVATRWLSPGTPRVRTASMGEKWAPQAEQMGMQVVDLPTMFSDRLVRAPSP